MMPDDGLDAHPRQGRDPVRLGRRPAHPRPHHAVGPAPEDLPGLRPVRQRAPDAHPARHRRPAQALRPGRPELGHRARELGRRILRRRRPRPPGPPDRGRHRRVHDDPRRRRTHHALRVQAGAVASTQAADRHHQEQRPAPRDGDVGRDRAADLEGVPGRHLGQGTRRRLDGAHDQPPGLAGHDRRDQPARRHPERPGRRAGRQPGHRADRQHRSGAPLPVDVRADPRFGLRHHGQGPRQSGRHLLVGRDAAGASGRATTPPSA